MFGALPPTYFFIIFSNILTVPTVPFNLLSTYQTNILFHELLFEEYT
jgi:hypothetical protein